MEHVVAGQLNKQIAADLGTGEQNIKLHRAHIMQKMGVESLADLVRAAERLGVESSVIIRREHEHRLCLPPTGPKGPVARSADFL